MTNKDYIRIDKFPHDGQLRVIWAYGSVCRSNGVKSTNITVEVALRRLHNNIVNVNQEAEIYDVPISELDAVRLGSLWKGNTEVKKYWSGFSKLKNGIIFSFDFEADTVGHVCYRDARPDSTPVNKRLYVPPYILNLKCIPVAKRYHFLHSRLTVLAKTDGMTVLIPSLELFTSTYAPEHKGIRRKLMSSDINTVLEDFVERAEATEDVPQEYSIKTIKSHTKRNVEFLSYLSLNQVTRNRVSKIWASLNNVRDPKYTERYPKVEPYHPRFLDLKVDGIQLDSNHFLVLRVMESSHPIEHKIKSLVTKYKSEASSDKHEEKLEGEDSKTYENTEEARVTDDVDPNKNKGKTRVATQVQPLGESLVSVVIDEKITVEAQQKKNRNNKQSFNQPPEILSSGEPNSNTDSEGVQQLESGEPSIEQTKKGVFDQVRDALDILVRNEKSGVKGYGFINVKAQEVSKISFITFPKSNLKVSGSSYNWWVTMSHQKENGKILFKPRRVLLVRVVLDDERFAYLLEIERRNSSERFCGLIFNVREPAIAEESIASLLQKIAENKGAFRRKKGKLYTVINLGLDKSTAYKHKSSEGLIDAEFMDRVIKRGAQAGIFLNDSHKL